MLMPQNKFAFARYRIIDFMLRRHDYVKTAAIVEQCRSRTGFDVTSRTIELDIAAMRYDTFLGYFAPIVYDSRRKAYCYERPYTLSPKFFTGAEYSLLREICSVCRARISDQKYNELERIVFKIELLSE